MNDLWMSAGWLAWLSDAALTLIGLTMGLLVYGSLVDQTIFEGRGCLQSLRFARVDIVGGILLAAFLLLLTFVGYHASAPTAHPPPMPGPMEMIAATIVSALIFLIVIAGILVSLTAREIRWRECFGLTRMGPIAVVGWAVVLILMAFPLVIGAIALSRVLLAAAGYVDDSPQEVVTFLGNNPPAAARWVVAVFAVVAAPMEEEFLFRGYLYGILRRYAGPAVGIVLNAALFATIHQHLPSFGGLFVLAVCLTLAYEWTGSLFVPMVMHAIFNSLTVIQLLTGHP